MRVSGSVRCGEFVSEGNAGIGDTASEGDWKGVGGRVERRRCVLGRTVRSPRRCRRVHGEEGIKRYKVSPDYR